MKENRIVLHNKLLNIFYYSLDTITLKLSKDEFIKRFKDTSNNKEKHFLHYGFGNKLKNRINAKYVNDKVIFWHKGVRTGNVICILQIQEKEDSIVIKITIRYLWGMYFFILLLMLFIILIFPNGYLFYLINSTILYYLLFLVGFINQKLILKDVFRKIFNKSILNP